MRRCNRSLLPSHTVSADTCSPFPQVLLRDFILTFRKKTTRFYYHTDQQSIHAVIAELEVLSLIAQAN